MRVALVTLLMGIPALSNVAGAHSPPLWTFTVTNGGSMPISPGVLYLTRSSSGLEGLGSPASAGLVQLCQMGNPTGRAAELATSSAVRRVVKTDGPILPGASRSTQFRATPRDFNGLHFVAMYGKTKDTCATISVGKVELWAAAGGAPHVVEGSDRVIATGAFREAVLPTGERGDAICANQNSAVDCLRQLAIPADGAALVRAGRAYLPSVTHFLESRYGAEDTQSVIFSTAGALSYRLEVSR